MWVFSVGSGWRRGGNECALAEEMGGQLAGGAWRRRRRRRVGGGSWARRRRSAGFGCAIRSPGPSPDSQTAPASTRLDHFGGLRAHRGLGR